MNDERIESLIRGRYESIRATRQPRARRRWLVPAVSAAGAVAAGVAVLTISLHPTPAQAFDQAEKALANAVSFQVRVGTDTGRGEKFDLTIKRSGDLLIHDLDRPSVATFLIVQDKRESWLQPKGEKVIYRGLVNRDEPAYMTPEEGESFLDFLIRTLWQPRSAEGHQPVEMIDSSPTVGMRTIRYTESLTSTFMDRETKTDREVRLEVDKGTNRPATIILKEVSKPGVTRITRYLFSYNTEPREPFEDYFTPGSRIVDLDASLREIHSDWNRRKPLADNGKHQVVETFRSPLGWTAVVVKGPILHPESAFDQEGHRWLAQYRQEREDFRVIHLTPLEPDQQAAAPLVTIQLKDAEALKVPVPKVSMNELPDWILPYGGVVKKWRFDIEAVGMRCMYYQSTKDDLNELRWRKVYATQAEKIGGALLTMQRQRVAELEEKLKP